MRKQQQRRRGLHDHGIEIQLVRLSDPPVPPIKPPEEPDPDEPPPLQDPPQPIPVPRDPPPAPLHT